MDLRSFRGETRSSDTQNTVVRERQVLRLDPRFQLLPPRKMVLSCGKYLPSLVIGLFLWGWGVGLIQLTMKDWFSCTFY